MHGERREEKPVALLYRSGGEKWENSGLFAVYVRMCTVTRQKAKKQQERSFSTYCQNTKSKRKKICCTVYVPVDTRLGL